MLHGKLVRSFGVWSSQVLQQVF